MAVWSIFSRSATQNLQKIRIFRPKVISNHVIGYSQTCNMSSEMVISASKWQWHKTKDWVHFYFFLMAIPLGIITFCTNVFIGPATLTEIPEGYYPKYWEYYKHPISRFLARYCYFNPQKDYEKSLHMIYVESHLMQIRKIEKKIWNLQAERQDMKYNTFLPYDQYHTRVTREVYRHT